MEIDPPITKLAQRFPHRHHPCLLCSLTTLAQRSFVPHSSHHPHRQTQSTHQALEESFSNILLDHVCVIVSSM